MTISPRFGLSAKHSIAVALAAVFLCSCSTAERRLTVAAAEQGRAQARVSLPDLPDDCRRKEQHAALSEGAEVRSILGRERDALDRQNARTDRCSAFYDDTKGRLQNG